MIFLTSNELTSQFYQLYWATVARNTLNSMISNGTIWFILAGVIIIVIAIVIAIKKRKKK